MKKILAINPGSTSTKIAVYEDEKPTLEHTIRHSVEELSRFPRVIDQKEFRRDLVFNTLAEHGIPFEFDAIIGRGGLLRPIPAGIYEVNDDMVDEMTHPHRDHACNLGCLIARDLADELPGCKAYIAYSGNVDDMPDIPRRTGSPIMPRITTWHGLTQRAIGCRYSAVLSKDTGGRVKYEDLNLIICHLGGGISIGAHDHGVCVDVNNAFDGEGPFSPERPGTLPTGALIDLCYSGRYTKEQLKKRISGNAGLAILLGTVSIPEIEERIAGGDDHARLVLDAMCYQVAKAIAAQGAPLFGNVDAILLTGGIAHSQYVVPRIIERVKYLAPVRVYPGEDELKALANNALDALNGDQPVRSYTKKKACCLAEPQLN